MNEYRSFQKCKAVQFTGDPIPEVTCDGTADGCGSDSRRFMLHVHTMHGLRCVKPGDWITPVVGGPFAVIQDGTFRAHYEVPDVTPVQAEAVAAALEPEVPPPPVVEPAETPTVAAAPEPSGRKFFGL